MLTDLLKGNFLAGYKTYAVLWGGIAVTWASFAFGVDLVCAWQDATGACTPPALNDAVTVTWAAVSGLFLRKAVQ